MSHQYHFKTIATMRNTFCLAAAVLFFGMSSKVFAQPLPANIDFSMGNFTNWSCYT
jgi:hypothetical protein